MTIDAISDPEHANKHVVVCKSTGDIVEESIFYADDEAGFFLCYVRDDRGAYCIDNSKSSLVVKEVQMDIEVVPWEDY